MPRIEGAPARGRGTVDGMQPGMEPRFQRAEIALRTGDRLALEQLLADDPELARARSARSHPTLLQCLVLDGMHLPAQTQVALAASLVAAGADCDAPLVACGSQGNIVLADFLLDHGAALDGRPDLQRGWTVLEEALYWGASDLIDRLLQRGAGVHNLRTAAGLGRLDRVLQCFDGARGLDRARAGEINWPFGELPPEQRSDEPRDLLDHALVYAVLGGHVEVVRLLLAHGASLDAFPRGFHVRGTALHWAALRGLGPMCQVLIELGADRRRRDGSFDATPAGWARHGHHEILARELETAG